MVIAGAALIKGAKSLQLTSLDIGGPEVHVHQSGCADVRVPDDQTAISMIRAEVAKTPSTAVEFYRHGWQAQAPLDDAGEIVEIFPADYRHIFDMHKVISRLVDGSLFHEVMENQGKEVITGLARIGGLWMGVVANNPTPHKRPDGAGMRPGGILYREGIAKISAFSRACDSDGIPIVWLQDIAGFDIGVEAEAQGLLGFGSSLIYTNSTNTTPMFTVLMRKASGAGYYAMAGHPYEPVVQLSTLSSRLSVMEGRTLAIAAYNTKLDDDFEIATTDPKERAEIEAGMRRTEARIEADMDPVVAAANMDTDEVVCLDELRGWLVLFAEVSYQASGRRRIKNPRIWSIHDLCLLTQGRGTEPPAITQPKVANQNIEAPHPDATPVFATMDGSIWLRPKPGAPPFVSDGAKVDRGETIALMEIMKTYSPLRASDGGVWLGAAVADGDPVSAGQIIGWLRLG